MENFLDRNKLKEISPSIFAEQGCPNKVSKKYSFHPTSIILDDLEKMGWYPVRVKESNTLKQENIGYQKHIIVFRKKEYLDNTNLQVNDIVPELVEINSHLGNMSHCFMMGFFRKVCSNGLMVSDSIFEPIKIRHQGYTFKEVEKMVMQYIDSLPNIVENINLFKKIKLTLEQKLEFTKEVISLRWNNKKYIIEPNKFLSLRRKEDEGDDLWTVFNILQENFIKGGISYKLVTGKSNTTRGFSYIDEYVKYNKLIWGLMVQFASRYSS